MKFSHPSNPLAVSLFSATALLAPHAAFAVNGSEIFRDDFNTFSSANWSVANWTQGRTQWGSTPTTSAGIATFKLDTYNPSNPGVTFKSAEIVAKTFFTPSTGLEFEARVRTNSVTPGLVAAFFTYGTHNDPVHGTVNDEIDFEFLTKDNNPAPAGGSDSFWAVAYNDYYSGSADPSNKESAHPQVPGLDTNAFNTFKIRLFPDRTEWWVNGTRVQALSQAIPNDPMAVEFSLWAPDASWQSAYSASLAPSATPAGNTSHTYDVDYISVRRLANQWTSNTSGTWSNDANWSASNPSAIGAVANFLDAPANPVTVTLTTGRFVGTLNLDSPNAYTFKGTSALLFDVAAGSAAINVTQGAHTIQSPTKLNDNLTITVAAGGTLNLSGTLDNSQGKSIATVGAGTVNLSGANQIHAAGSSLTTSAGLTNLDADLAGPSGNANLALIVSAPTTLHANQHLASLTLTPAGKLDLTDNDLFLATPNENLRSSLAARQLFSSTADADPNHLLAVGYSATLLKLTYPGDANLDGALTPDDYALLDRGYAKHLATWQDGDFNYDGAINDQDYAILDRAYILLGSPRSPAFLSERESQFGTQYIAQLLVSVPEPASLSSIFLIPLFIRRRKP